MKLNKIFATAVATVAMFTVNATQAIADMYHAKKVECTLGVSSETVGLKYIGVSLDGSEVWAGENTTGNTAYLGCNIDGSDYTVVATNIDGNKEQNLEELSWYYRPLLRKLPSEDKQTLFVKVKGKESTENKFVAWDQKEIIGETNFFWWIESSVKIERIGEPVYHADVDSFTQRVKWEMTGINDELFKEAYIYCSIDGGEWWVYRGHYTAENMQKEVDVVFPGRSETVMFLIEVYPKDCYAGLVNNLGCWCPDPTPEITLTKPSNAKQKTMANEDSDATTGIESPFSESKPNTTVDIYSISGERVAQGVSLKEAANSLSRDIYVVNGKKMMLGK